MTTSIRNPFALFRFAVRENDWTLAALLAHALGGSRAGRRRLDIELTRVREHGEPAPTLFGLRVLARLIRFYRRG